MGALYRARQFWAALRPRVSAAEWALVRSVLGPGELALFARLPRAYQRHGLNVLHQVQAAGGTDSALLRAALLHDAAKGIDVRLPHRVLVVLLARFAPGLLARLGRDAAGWRRPFCVHCNHAALGAELARAAGAPALTVALIALHHAPPAPGDSEALRLLREADSAE